jgi:hypothetical protein
MFDKKELDHLVLAKRDWEEGCLRKALSEYPERKEVHHDFLRTCRATLYAP